MIKIFAVIIIALSLISCSRTVENKQVDGGLIGFEILDPDDRSEMVRSTLLAFEIAENNRYLVWQNRDTGNYGSTMPINSWSTGQGQYCREYRQSYIIVGREMQVAYSIACRQSDGQWRRKIQ